MFLSLIEGSPEIVPKTSWKLPYKNPCIICLDSVDRLHGVSLEAGSPGEALGSLVSDSLHRVHGSEAWVHNRCSLCRESDMG